MLYLNSIEEHRIICNFNITSHEAQGREKKQKDLPKQIPVRKICI